MTSQAYFDNGSARADMAAFLRDLVHELASPLNSLSMNVEILQALVQKQSDSMAAGAIERLCQDHVRLEHLLRGLRAYAAALEKPSREAVDLRDLIDEARAMTLDEGVSPMVTVVADQESRISIDRTSGGCAVAAILRNAAEAGASQVVVAAEAAAGKIHLFFDDDGPGIADPARARVLDAFFTAQKDDTHFGLGLTMARAVALGHGGDIEVRMNPLGGARIVFAIRDTEESISA